MTRRATGSEAGFTLVETLVAFTILAAVIIVSFQTLTESTKRLAEIKERDHRTTIARDAFGHFLLSIRPPARETTGAAEGISWTIAATPIGGDEAQLQATVLRPYRVQVFVDNSAKRGTDPVLDTIVLFPRAEP